MLLSARPSRRRSARTSLRVTPPRRSVPSGPSRSVNLTRRTSRSTHPRLSVRRFPKNFAAHPAVIWCPAQRSASPRPRLLFPRCQRRPATWSPKRSASTSPSWFPCSSPLRSASTSPRRSAPGPARTQGRSRSQLSRSGATSPLPSLALPNLSQALYVSLPTHETHTFNHSLRSNVILVGLSFRTELLVQSELLV